MMARRQNADAIAGHSAVAAIDDKPMRHAEAACVDGDEQACHVVGSWPMP
jgi:hypothetical protein